jgi:SAM-dependent methyltransferase
VADPEKRYDRDFWERLWSRTLRERADDVASRPPNAHLTGAVGDLRPGLALDAGCGHGSDTLWLAARGWRVTAVDFSAAALQHARSTADAAGAEIAGRVDWIEVDLGAWAPQPDHYDLVACLYVHVAGSVHEMVRRMAAGGQARRDPAARRSPPDRPGDGSSDARAGQVQVSVDAAAAALGCDRWALVVAEDRPRTAAGAGVDAVIRARRRS